MNVLFTDVMTVYNYCGSGDTERWSRSVIHGVQWSHNKTEVTVSGGVQTEAKVEKITVDFQRNYGNKPYLPPDEYRKLPPEQCGEFWTLDAKSGQDVIVLGEIAQEIGREYRLSALKKDFQYAVTVTAVSDNRNRMRLKNIKVVGK
ncbi:MAG: hypothetical protein HDR06_12185 [Lachnospiraceae bacterium]|nr:hypothetical protein [Lachnospiraceae bacterium]